MASNDFMLQMFLTSKNSSEFIYFIEEIYKHISLGLIHFLLGAVTDVRKIASFMRSNMN